MKNYNMNGQKTTLLRLLKFDEAVRQYILLTSKGGNISVRGSFYTNKAHRNPENPPIEKFFDLVERDIQTGKYRTAHQAKVAAVEAFEHLYSHTHELDIILRAIGSIEREPNSARKYTITDRRTERSSVILNSKFEKFLKQRKFQVITAYNHRLALVPLEQFDVELVIKGSSCAVYNFKTNEYYGNIYYDSIKDMDRFSFKRQLDKIILPNINVPIL